MAFTLFVFGVLALLTPFVAYGLEIEEWITKLNQQSISTLQASIFLGILCIFLGAAMVL
jgi:fluoride ion exporter CrcB/FEX